LGRNGGGNGKETHIKSGEKSVGVQKRGVEAEGARVHGGCKGRAKGRNWAKKIRSTEKLGKKGGGWYGHPRTHDFGQRQLNPGREACPGNSKRAQFPKRHRKKRPNKPKGETGGPRGGGGRVSGKNTRPGLEGRAKLTVWGGQGKGGAGGGAGGGGGGRGVMGKRKRNEKG